LCKRVAGSILDLASIFKFNNKLINNDSPGTDWHGPFLLDVINCQINSLHGRLVIGEHRLGFGVFSAQPFSFRHPLGCTNTFESVTEQTNGGRINQKDLLEGQPEGSAVRQTLFPYFYSCCICFGKN